MVKLEITKKQAYLINKALDFYSRVGIGQFDVITDHPTFERHLHNEFKNEKGKTDYSKYHPHVDMIRKQLITPRNMLYNDNSLGGNGSWGIYNKKVDESCREAYDIHQVIRHAFWKKDLDRSSITVDSSVHLTTKDSDKIKCEIL